MMDPGLGAPEGSRMMEVEVTGWDGTNWSRTGRYRFSNPDQKRCAPVGAQP